MNRIGISGMLLITVCLTSSGCSQKKDHWLEARPKVYPASGEILFDGAPLSYADVIFFSPTENISGFGKTDSSGRFQLSTFGQNDGVVSGEHLVTVTKLEAVLPDSPEIALDEVRSLIPERYGQRGKSGLTANVDSQSKSNHFQFNLAK